MATASLSGLAWKASTFAWKNARRRWPCSMPANRSAAWPAPTWSRIAFCNRVPGEALKLIRLGQRRLASGTPTEDNDPDKGVTHVPLPCDTHVSWLNTAQEVLEVVESDLYPRLETIYADTKYHNYALYEWIEDNVD